MNDDLRRISRVSVCCRAVVCDRYGLWTGVTENVSARGCLIVTARLLRPGTVVAVALSSDLFPDEFETSAEVTWSTPDRMGVSFAEVHARAGALSAEAWFEKVLEFGETPDTPTSSRVVPFVDRSGTRRLAPASGRSARLVRTPTPSPVPAEIVTRLPLRRA